MASTPTQQMIPTIIKHKSPIPFAQFRAANDTNDNDQDDDFVLVQHDKDNESESEHSELMKDSVFVNKQDDDIDDLDDDNDVNISSSSDNINENDEEKDLELISNDKATPKGDNNRKQQLFAELTQQKPDKQHKKQTKNARYFDLISNENTHDLSGDSDDDDDDSEDDMNIDQQSDNSDDDSDDSDDNENTSSDSDDDDDDDDDCLSSLSKLEFEKLICKTMDKLALKFVENDQNNSNNSFSNNDDKILLTSNDIGLNMKDILSFIPDYDNNNDSDQIDDNVNDPDILDLSIISQYDNNQNIMPLPNKSSSNHPYNLKNSKLTTTVFDKSNGFIREELRLASSTMKKSITYSRNIENKNYCLPLSSLDHRIRNRRKKKDNAGSMWFNMGRGKLTPQNKLHFLMLKYRHIIYRDYKPPKVKDDYIPEYFKMGKIIEGPTEFYSSRLTKRQRKNSWANEYLSNSTTKEWLEEKTKRALKRIRRPGKQWWIPMRKLNVNNRYKLRKKIIKNRKKKGWNNNNNNKR